MPRQEKPKRVFIICPARGITEEEKIVLEGYVHALEVNGCKVHWPPRDTNQDDSIGLRICRENRWAIERADEVHIWWNEKSQGSVFDFGMAFASQKMIVLINPDKVQRTEGKSFNNVLLELIEERK